VEYVDGKALSAVLVRSDAFADALAGTPLAVAKQGPLLLTASDALDGRVQTELQRVLPSGSTVYLLGGTGALSQAVQDRVQAMGYNPVRLFGSNRFETAVAVADQGLGNPSVVFLTNGLNFPDALAAGPAAAMKKGAVLLTLGGSMHSSVSNYLSAHPNDQRYAVGGPAAQADPSATAVVGADRYDTARKVASTFFSSPVGLAVASGVTFPDALSGGVLAGAAHGPLVLSDPAFLPSPSRDYLVAQRPTIFAALLIGGTAALSDNVRNAVAQAIGAS
jgi:putative cell wall-binding protein